ncbi:MAG: PHP domain-containing protein [Lachnospiraceae bacterium]|nr:PHP domain-containing protein [Lachnospiraceae bacterium]
MEYIDLHVHSTASDGSMTPSELVAYAMEKNLYAFALTDHDTVDGIEEASRAVNQANQTRAKDERTSHDEPDSKNSLIFIPGIELSAEYKGQDIHILGLNIDYQNQEFLKKVEYYRNQRNQRNEKMALKLKEMGFDITQEQITNRFGADTVITRAHYAILLKENGYVQDYDEAFTKYLNPGCPCYIPRTKIDVCDAVKLILLANGKPVLAHPVLYKLSEKELDALVQLLKSTGLLGIEAIYSKNKGNDEIRMRELAKKYGLFITGGSDFHGTAKPGLDLGCGYGDLKIPKDILNNII